MVTRLYVPNSSVELYPRPALDAGWNYTTENVYRSLVTTKTNSALVGGGLIGALSGTATHKGISFTAISAPIKTQITLNGTVKSFFMVREGANTDNIDRRWTKLYVLAPDDTVRGTLLALAARGNTTEPPTSFRSSEFLTSGTALTSVIAQPGDRLVLELGMGNNTAGTSPEFEILVGDPTGGADSDENETNTTQKAGWIEFSQDIDFADVGVPNSYMPDATGRGMQRHLIKVGSTWWLFWIDHHTGTKIRSATSTDLVSWTERASTDLPISSGSPKRGVNFSLYHRNISGTDVVHMTVGLMQSSTARRAFHGRFTISGTTLTNTNTWGQVGTDSTFSDATNREVGMSTYVDQNGRVWVLHSWHNTGSLGDPYAFRSNNTDSGSAWTSGFATPVRLILPTQYVLSCAFEEIGNDNMLGLFDDGSTATQMTTVQYEEYTGGAWTDINGNVLGTTFTASNKNNWTSVKRTDTDTWWFARDPTQSAGAYFLVRRYDGSAWSAGTEPPDLATKADAGLFAASDGTDIWLFAIDNAAGNAVRYTKWSSGSGTWSAWTGHETASATRSNISGQPIVSGSVGVIWTEGPTSGIYTIKGKVLALSQQVTLNQATETSTAQPFGRQKLRTSNQATETDTAQPFARQKRRALNQATEAQTAQPFGKRKMVPLGQAVETDTAQPFTRGSNQTIVALNQATETDTALAFTRRKLRTLNQATETSAAQSTTGRKTRTLLQATEADTAQPVAKQKRRTTGLATETSTAQPFARRKQRTLGQAVEAQTAQHFGSSINVPLNRATETSTALAFSRSKQRTLSQAVEVSVAQPVAKRKIRVLVQVTETSTAQQLRGVRFRPLNQAVETNVALAFVRYKQRVLGQAVEFDTALPLIRFLAVVEPWVQPRGELTATPRGALGNSGYPVRSSALSGLNRGS